jgi:hypothetical protein
VAAEGAPEIDTKMMAGATVIVAPVSVALPELSVTVMLKVEVPAVVGVPLTAPVVEESERPTGSAPLESV